MHMFARSSCVRHTPWPLRRRELAITASSRPRARWDAWSAATNWSKRTPERRCLTLRPGMSGSTAVRPPRSNRRLRTGSGSAGSFRAGSPTRRERAIRDQPPATPGSLGLREQAEQPLAVRTILKIGRSAACQSRLLDPQVKELEVPSVVDLGLQPVAGRRHVALKRIDVPYDAHDRDFKADVSIGTARARHLPELQHHR